MELIFVVTSAICVIVAMLLVLFCCGCRNLNDSDFEEAGK